MFQQTFVTERVRSHRPMGVFLSFSLQAMALGVIILLQLFYTQPIPAVSLRAILIGPRPPVPQPKTLLTSVSTHAEAPRAFVLRAPVAIPNPMARTTVAITPAPPDTGLIGLETNEGAGSDLLIGMNKGTPAPPPPQAPIKPASIRAPMKIGGSVAAANLIHQVQPVFPPLARSARVEGTVEFTAIIDKNGRVVNLQLVRGHPLLIGAAREAILQWRYKPTMLNSEPVEVATTITVNFRLSN